MSESASSRLRSRLGERRAQVLARWRTLIVEGTPRANRPAPTDPFHDPIGISLWRTTAALLEVMCADGDFTPAATCLDELVRIRSVQEMSASEAVRFVLLLRAAIRDVIPEDLAGATVAERAALDDRLDALALQAFDAYTRCREKLSDLRARETMSRSFVLLERARRLLEEREPATTDPAGGGST